MSRSPTPRSAVSQTSSVCRSRVKTPWSIAYLTISGAATAPACQSMPVSIDTAKAEVARHALGLGAELVNDVTALRGDADLAELVAESGAYLCLMHMQGEPRTMQAQPSYDDVVVEVASFLEERLRFA